MKKQLHLVENAAKTSGGEGLAALRYAESVSQAGCLVIFASKSLSTQEADGSITPLFKQHIAPIRKNVLVEMFVQYQFIRKLYKKEKFDQIHLHGVWSPLLVVAALFARRMHVPLAISPHGCLEAWALAYKPKKKQLALRTYQGAVLRSASMFIATANQELESLRQLGFRQPVAVIPNGVDVGPPPLREAHGAVKMILFLSRVHPKKGLLDLVEAWGRVRRPGWRIVIAGGDEEGYRAKVEALVRAKELQSDFEFVGFVDGARKQACFDAADIFILPTYSENFGIAVAEALANELPVITTTGAPWQDLVEHRCGWWVEPGVQGVSGALIEAMECDPAELRKMGQRGRQLVLNKYSWAQIGSTALATSQWLLNQSLPKPDAVKVFGQ